MPKYKDRREKLREFLQLLDVEDYSDMRSVFQEMVGAVLDNGLEVSDSLVSRITDKILPVVKEWRQSRFAKI